MGNGGEKVWWAKVLKHYRKTKSDFDLYFWRAYWDFRFMVWDVNKRTPAMMYDRLNVVKATSPADKSYHIYINCLSFYEFYHGPTYNPIHVYGPKFKTD
ncbi:hypothetical protein PPTG_10033 [Phytophthora nicotianae INRA-310]|uniref:RxLR effector protein n=1 Tax=Phytophthora nicotianae (strain INRA-310) TaxID=761204 RepID=W2QER8_PHYN3|nr:hypothetical protein PPTG_10033 [Phytophthora nicotianae INRA-310]ETN11019.1 hypothetical protein PPTG_10033 [Phytophthora nicotianae INRA-310]